MVNMKRKLIALAVAGILIAGCNCSPNPKYRCSEFGIVEVQKAWQWTDWEPLSGSAIVRCEPGKPITAENLK